MTTTNYLPMNTESVNDDVDEQGRTMEVTNCIMAQCIFYRLGRWDDFWRASLCLSRIQERRPA